MIPRNRTSSRTGAARTAESIGIQPSWDMTWNMNSDIGDSLSSSAEARRPKRRLTIRGNHRRTGEGGQEGKSERMREQGKETVIKRLDGIFHAFFSHCEGAQSRDQDRIVVLEPPQDACPRLLLSSFLSLLLGLLDHPRQVSLLLLDLPLVYQPAVQGRRDVHVENLVDGQFPLVREVVVSNLDHAESEEGSDGESDGERHRQQVSVDFREDICAMQREEEGKDAQREKTGSGVRR